MLKIEGRKEQLPCVLLPNTIQIVSDENILKLKSHKKDTLVYQYTDSITKIGVELQMDEKQF